MEVSRICCICRKESEFNVSLFGNFCRRTNMLDKIFACLQLVIEEGDALNTICYKCAETIERFYNFQTVVTNVQTRSGESQRRLGESQRRLGEPQHARALRRTTAYVRDQLIDTADYTFPFHDVPEENHEPQRVPPRPFFSYLARRALEEPARRAPRARRPRRSPRGERPRRSPDLFESPAEPEPAPARADWTLTPDDDLLRRIRNRCFGQSDF